MSKILSLREKLADFSGRYFENENDLLRIVREIANGSRYNFYISFDRYNLGEYVEEDRDKLIHFETLNFGKSYDEFDLVQCGVRFEKGKGYYVAWVL